MYIYEWNDNMLFLKKISAIMQHVFTFCGNVRAMKVSILATSSNIWDPAHANHDIQHKIC